MICRGSLQYMLQPGWAGKHQKKKHLASTRECGFVRIDTYYGEIMIDTLCKTIAAIASLATIIFGVFVVERTLTIKRLKQEIEDLKRKILRTSSKVNPETNRVIILEAQKSIQILGINALGTLHHCREELIEFLSSSQTRLQVLLLDPACDEFKKRVAKEHDDSGRILQEWRASIRILKEIAQKSKGIVELRLHQNAPDRSLLIVDSEDNVANQSKMIINYYPKQEGMRGYSGVQFLSEYILPRDRDSFFKNRNFFQESWAREKPRSISEMLNR